MKWPEDPPSDEAAPASRKLLMFNEFRFDPDGGALQRNGTDLVLLPRALSILRCLLAHTSTLHARLIRVEPVFMNRRESWKPASTNSDMLFAATEKGRLLSYTPPAHPFHIDFRSKLCRKRP